LERSKVGATAWREILRWAGDVYQFPATSESGGSYFDLAYANCYNKKVIYCGSLNLVH
jgi:hypothetical protein